MKFLAGAAIALFGMVYGAAEAQTDWKNRLELWFSDSAYDSVCALYEKHQEDLLLTGTDYGLAVKAAKSFYYMDRNSKSLTLYQLLYDTPAPDSSLFLDMIIDYAIVLIETGRYSQAKDILARGSGLAVSYGDKRDAARLLYRYAVFSIRTGAYHDALRFLDSAWAESGELHDPGLRSGILTVYGIVYRELGFFTWALETYGRAVEIDSSAGNIHDLAVDYMNIGNVYNDLGMFRKSIQSYETAARCYGQLRDTSGLSMVYGNLGAALYDMGDYEKSRGYLSRSVLLNRGMDTLGLANAKLNLAVVMVKEKRFTGLDDLLSETAAVYSRLSRKSEQGFALTCLGRVYRQTGKPLNAEKCFKEAIELFGQTENPDLGWIAYAEYAGLKFQSRDTSSALSLLTRATKNLESLRSGNEDESVLTRFMENELQETYRFYVYLNILKGKNSEAVRALENIKARTLDTPDCTGARWDSSARIVEFFNYDSLWFAFTFLNEKINVRFLPGPADLRLRVRDYYHLIRSEKSDTGRLKVLSSRLYNQLMAPIMTESGGTGPLVIVPDGILHYLPFETLWTGNSFLVERFAVRYVPAMRMFRRNTGLQDAGIGKGASVLIFKSDYRDMGNGMQGVPFEPLPHIEQEKTAIRGHFSGDSVTVLDGIVRESDIRNLGMDSISILHMATHGLNNPVYPEMSSLVVGTDTDSAYDGYLTAGEIEKMSLKARLVVLSACETSLGEMLMGEGMIGLTRAFLKSGSGGVISTLWKIRDSATAKLMDRFYHYLKKENSDPGSALQKAKTDLLNSDYAHPFFWGAFVMWGR